MYSGITRGTFPVVSVTAREGATRFTVRLPRALAEGATPGASIAADGVCLTVVQLDEPSSTLGPGPGPSLAAGQVDVSFDAVAETLALTTLSDLHVGRELSIERSCKVGDELGGHDVFGHVIGTGKVIARNERGAQLDLRIAVPAAWMKFILHKGFVALDGSSLTVGEVQRDSFDVHLIPETLRVTGFAKKQVGDRINVELDSRTVAIVETVERVLAERAPAAGAALGSPGKREGSR